MDTGLIKQLLWPDSPRFPNCRSVSREELLDGGLTMANLFIGEPGRGKTKSLAHHLVGYAQRHPDEAIFVADRSGQNIEDMMSITLQQHDPDQLIRRFIYDDLGNPDWILPLPEFSHEYGTSSEEQVQRVAENLVKLAPELVKDAPYLAGLGLKEAAPQVFRLLAAVQDEFGDSWQVTEAKRLVADKDLLTRLVTKFGGRVPQAKWFIEEVFLKLPARERELRTYALISLLGAIETPEARARIGYYRPGWTPKEAIEQGKVVLIDGARVRNQKNTSAYLFTQAFSLIMQEINKRLPADPKDKRVSIVLDEVYSLLSVPGMATEISELSTQYRSRKVQLYIVLQELAQLSEELLPHIWSFGNIVCFAIANFQEAYEIGQQLFPYYPETVKLTPKTPTQQPVIEADRGQYLQIANSIQRMKHRECIIRRYKTEQDMEKYILWVKKTAEIPNRPTSMTVAELKDKLLHERGIRVRDALKDINARKTDTKPVPKEPPHL